MNRDYLTAEQVKSMLIAVSEAVVAAKDQLADADRAIGDGDHGIGMANGFSAAKEKLEAAEPQDVYALFALTGQTLIRVMGGASGIIFGSLFWAGAKGKEPQGTLSPKEFAGIFQAGLEDVMRKGGAKPGDKTVVDALDPMVKALQEQAEAGKDFLEVLRAGSAAAEAGKEASKQYVAKFGKAKSLGERAVGFPDAGAVSLTVIAQAMLNWAEQEFQGA